MARKKKRKSRPRAKWHLGGGKAKLSRKRGHKPVALLQLYHRKMEKNLGKLEGVIARRKAAGE
jgi:hypothetical protein